MSSGPSTVCTHDLGPGTKVCLRCRQEQREANRARQQRIVVKASVIGLGLVFAYVLGASVVSAVRSGSTSHRNAEPPSMLATTEVVQQGVRRAPSVTTPAQALSASGMPVTSSTPEPSHVTASGSTPFAFVVPEGRTDASDGVIIERTGDTVVVDFDVNGSRTRRPEKFDRTVRQTLPRVYGPQIEAVLKTIPEGELASGGDLLAELPTRGIHLTLSNGWTIDVFPETHPGRDGPLVVSYRTFPRKS